MTGRTCEFKRGDIVVVSNQRGREGEHATGLLKGGISDKQKTGLFDVMRVVKIKKPFKLSSQRHDSRQY